MPALKEKIRGPVYKLSETEGSIKQGDIKEIQVLREGSFYVGKYGNKPIPITKQILLSMVENFKKKIKPNEASLDFNHDAGDRAAGWIKNLFTKTNDNGKMELWSETEITGAGAEELSQKNFKYTSADFTLNYVDNETLKEHGPLLEGLALTNRPVVKGMQAIMLSEQTGDNMTLEEALAMIETLKAEIEELKKKLPVQNAEEKTEELTAKEVQLSERIKVLEGQAKEAQFNEMLAKGTAVVAQKEAFLKGDIVEFSRLSKNINFSEKGSKKTGGDEDEQSLDEEIQNEMKAKNISFSEAMKIVTKRHKSSSDLYKNYSL